MVKFEEFKLDNGNGTTTLITGRADDTAAFAPRQATDFNLYDLSYYNGDWIEIDDKSEDYFKLSRALNDNDHFYKQIEEMIDQALYDQAA